MQKGRNANFIRRKAGFTLVELLLVVGILIALFGIAFLGIRSLVISLRLKEMDSKAEIIYTAAQNRLATLRANGCEHYYQATRSDVDDLGIIPLDADTTVVEQDTLFYVTSDTRNGTGAAKEILPKGTVDYEIWDNHWIIEYEPTGGSVYAVFYSEQPLDQSIQELNMLRVRQARKNAGGYVGYYGGDIAMNELVLKLEPEVQVENGEKLKVTFRCDSPDAQPLTFTATVTDAFGTTRTIEGLEPRPEGKNSYTCSVYLDDLDGKRFAELFPDLAAGTNIKITLWVHSPNDMIDDTPGYADTNSLFDYNNTEDDSMAIIKFGRHLQNLDQTSGVHASITHAVQQQDISFADTVGVDTDWYTVYNDRDFQPITNENLLSYDGSYEMANGTQVSTFIRWLRTPAGVDGGLFANVRHKDNQTVTFQNITLTAAQVMDAQYAGVLAGRVTGKVAMENCRVFLDSTLGELNNKTKDDEWVSGNFAGGLVGYVGESGDLTVTDSFASTLLEATAQAGGLVGGAEGAVYVSGSYADCYITAPEAAGLVVGDAEVLNCYAAGYISGTDRAAGLVLGHAAKLKNAYSACVYSYSDGAVYSTAATGVADNVLFLQAADAINLTNTTAMLYEDLSDRTTVANLLNGENGTVFTANTGSNTTKVYNLDKHGVRNYSFPRLTSLPHYGDWESVFESGKLVYFEDYGGSQYGFSGGGKDTLRYDATSYVLGDGYGIVYDGTSKPTDNKVTVTYRGVDYELTECFQTADAGITYYIYPLPSAIVNDEPTADFYQKLTVHETDFYFNPHFAKTNTEDEGRLPEPPTEIFLRTARQLYLLSKHYSFYRDALEGAQFIQEMNIAYTGSIQDTTIRGYDWDSYFDGTVITYQNPIGTEQEPFAGKYDGRGHVIYNLNLMKIQEVCIGLFGRVAADSELKNMVLAADFDGLSNLSGQLNYGDEKDIGISKPGKELHMGALAGWNDGRITNCAVTGYTTDLNVYNGSIVHLGGLVGSNHGQIYNSTAVSCRTTLNINHSYAYVGGFVGINFGSIGSCYAIGAYRVEASKGSDTVIAGFAGQNSLGTIQTSYCAASLVASGTAQTAAFSPVGGIVGKDCYYLGNGAYYLAGTLYAFDASKGDHEGLSVDGTGLEEAVLTGYGDAILSRFYPNTQDSENNSYPYPAIVTDGNGQRIHYGDWTVKVPLGSLGIFYWEEEAGGSNDGVHFSYQGIDLDSPTDLLQGSNLCVSHEDEGTITQFGYGYYYRKDYAGVTFDQAGLAEAGNVSAILENQMDGYTFVAYTTGTAGDQLRPTDGQGNLACGVTYNGTKYHFTVSPFFADAMSYDGYGSAYISHAAKPGKEGNPYQIRSPQQLQYINWNWNTQNCTTTILKANKDDIDMVESYTYLRYMWYENSSSSPKSEGTHSGYNYYWQQSHDVDFQGGLFTPIGSLYDDKVATVAGPSGDGNMAWVNMAYFAGSYYGADYTIQNINIETEGACVGIFGTTMEANLENIALYADMPGCVIQNTAAGFNWYCIGGLVGYAGQGQTNNLSKITNCTVAGYTIQDNRGTENNGGWGGGNIGGLVGATNMDISKCSAVTDIVVNLKYKQSWGNVRVGGLVGGCRSDISECYAGGSIRSDVTNQGIGNGSTSIWVGGLVGGIVMRNDGNFVDLVGSVGEAITISNCYSYVALPQQDRYDSNNNHQIRNVQAIASIGELCDGGFGDLKQNAKMTCTIRNCYYLGTLAPVVDDRQPTNGDWNNHVTQTKDITASNRQTLIFNDRNPSLTYDQMVEKTGLLAYLNGAAGKSFAQVTTDENGASVHGKYTFPAGDETLVGRDYPFPTVLTQADRFNVNAQATDRVNVHYGVWPKVGLYWGQYETELDLFVHDENTWDDGTRYAELQNITLLICDDVDSGITLTPEDFLYYDADGNLITDEANAPARVLRVQKNGTDSFTVTLVPQKTGTMTIKPSKTNVYTNELFVKVTAELVVTASPNPVEQYRNDQTLVVLKATNRTELLAEATDLTELVTWTVYDPMDTKIAELGRDNLPANQVLVTGYDTGDTFFRVKAEYKGQSVTVLVQVTTLSGGFVGLSDGNVFNQTNLSTGGQGTDVTYTEKEPDAGSAALFLYADCQVDRFTITKVKVNGVETDTYSAVPVAGDAGYSYMALSVSSGTLTSADVEVTLDRGGKTYVLSIPNAQLEKLYQVELDANGGSVSPAEKYYAYGTAMGQLPIPTRAGYVFLGWYYGDQPVTEAMQTTRDMVLTAKWNPVYTVTFDANGGSVSETSRLVENGQKLGTLPTATLDGYLVDRWETVDGQTVTADTVVTGHLMVYPVWKDAKVKVELNANGGRFSNGAQTDALEVPSGTYVSQLERPTFTVSVMGYTWGHEFQYWQDSNGNRVSDTTEVTEGMQLTAVWKYNNVLIINNRDNGEQTAVSPTKNNNNNYVIYNFQNYGYYQNRGDYATVTVYDEDGDKIDQGSNKNRNWQVSGSNQNYQMTLYSRIFDEPTDLFVIIVDD